MPSDNVIARATAEIDVKPVGMEQFNRAMGRYGDVLLEPLILLAAGASKTEAAFMGLVGVVEYKMLGPLGLLSGVAASALISIDRLAKKFKDMGRDAAASLEMLEVQFKPLMKSAQLAAERVDELVEITKKTPFKQAGVIEANKTLQIFTQGALAAKDGMMLVGDAAAMAGAPLEDVAMWVGRLYDALQSGNPIGRATLRMQELGLMTGQTKRALEAMQESGASFTDMWRMVDAELKKATGSMNNLSETLDGLQSTVEDTADILGASFTQGFMEGEAAQLKRTIALMEGLTPVAKDMGEVFGAGYNEIEKFKTSIVEATVKTKTFEVATKGLIAGGLVLLTSAVAQPLAYTARFIGSLGLLGVKAKRSAAGMREMADAFKKAGHLGKAMDLKANLPEAFDTLPKDLSTLPQVMKGVTTQSQAVGKAMKYLAAGKVNAAGAALSFAKGLATSGEQLLKNRKTTIMFAAARKRLGLAGKALLRGDIEAAGTMGKLAAGKLKAAFAGNKLAASHMILKGVLNKVGTAMKWVAAQARAMAVAMFATPIGIAVTAIVALAAALLIVRKHYKDAKEASDEFKKATEDMVSTLEAQIRAVKTLNDLLKVQQGAMNNLTKAKMTLLEAERKGNKDEIANAKERVKEATRLAEDAHTFDRRKLSLTDDEKNQKTAEVDSVRRQKEMLRERDRSKMTPEELVKDKQKEYVEKKNARDKVLMDDKAYKDSEQRQHDISIQSAQDKDEITDLEARVAYYEKLKQSWMKYAGQKEGEFERPDLSKMMNVEMPDVMESGVHDLREMGNDVSGWLNNITGTEMFAKGENFGLNKEDMNKTFDEISKIDEQKKRLEELYSANYDKAGGFEAGLNSRSKEKRLETRIALREQTGSLNEQVLDQQKKIEGGELKGEAASEAKAELDRMKRQLAALMSTAGKYKISTGKGSAREASEDVWKLDELRKEKARQRDPVAVQRAKLAAEAEAEALSRSNKTEVLDFRRAGIGIKDDGLKDRLAELDIDAQRLENERKNGNLSQVQLVLRKKIVEAKREELQAEAGRRAETASRDTTLQSLKAQEDAARRLGNVEVANEARRRSDAIQDLELKKELVEQAKHLFKTEQEQNKFVKDRLASEKKIRDEVRAAEEAAQKRARTDSAKSQLQSIYELSEEMQKTSGNTKAAKFFKKQGEKIEDERLLASANQKYIGQGFEADKAKRMAERDVSLQQMQRKMQDINDLGDLRVTKHSLAAIGGGGGVAGIDPTQEKLKRSNELLKEMRDILKDANKDKKEQVAVML